MGVQRPAAGLADCAGPTGSGPAKASYGAYVGVDFLCARPGVAGELRPIGAAVQRFGSALNLAVYLYIPILDGVYTLEQIGPRVDRVGAPDLQALESLLDGFVRRIVRRLTRDGFRVEDLEQPAVQCVELPGLLYDLAGPAAADGRGMNPVFVYATDGTLVAIAAQEGMMRCMPPVT